MSFMQCTSVTGCPSFKGSIAEIRLWDTYRLNEQTLKFSKVNVTKLFLPGVVAYWRMVYEMTNLGSEVFDYSVNGNQPYVVPSTYSWAMLPTLLNVCNETMRYTTASGGSCTTSFSDSVS